MTSKRNFKILIVDDEKDYREVFKMILSDEGYWVSSASSGEDALNILKRENINLVLTDLIMPKMDGMQLLERIKKEYADTEVIVVTGYGTIETAVSAIKKGAFSYFIKSRKAEELLIEIEKLEKLHHLEKDNKYWRNQQNRNVYLLKTKNKKYENVLKVINKAAVSNASILITGESGVGKEIVARRIHELSSRKNGHFVAVNCQSLSENLLESELFGHEKGAFTGANERRIGRFEEADDGTLFLDEIGEMPINIQTKLLRTLENRTIERIGSNREISVNLRLISATNRNIYKAVENGDFREDLFYRINTIIINIPPLRDRKEDLPMFIDFFFNKFSKEQKKEITFIEKKVKDYLLTYNYPGNIRELKNIIERLVVLSEKGVVRKDDLPENRIRKGNNIQHSDTIMPLKEYKKKVESKYISEALAKCNGNITKTSQILNISRRQLFNKITEYNLKP
ncbi:sigma-54 dependent transcriptional regulator [Clostridium sp. JN-1]|uniref:sigma-54-dependent transcriptional regulator n=1 Tax=Clostridium sp. JN-1 TaxID=2483110 RepID=UPI000F0B1195|nr:sigma-54 dependent transcriptional regulator [Clostridium sp. JN-1]